MKYNINKAFITQYVDDIIVTFDSEKSVIYTLNETAAIIFNGIKRGWSDEKNTQKLVEEFDIDEKNAKKDLADCVSDLLKKKIILVQK
jgi:molybdopterin synthase catalytic subunit